MMYLFMKLNDETEIVHSDMKEDGTVKVILKLRMKKMDFIIWLIICRTYEVKDVNGYSDKQVEKFVEIIKSKAHLIIELAKEYGTPKGSE